MYVESQRVQGYSVEDTLQVLLSGTLPPNSELEGALLICTSHRVLRI